MTTRMKQLKPTVQDCTCRVVMLGQTGVGKSALVVRYLTNRFIWDYDPTLECAYKHVTVIEDDTINLEILDTAGQITLAHTDGQIRWGEGFILVFSVDDRASFNHISRIKARLDELKTTRGFSCVVVANKCDLQRARVVSSIEGQKLASEIGCAYYETSACVDRGEVQSVFVAISKEIRRTRLREINARRKSSTTQVRHVLNKVFTKMQSS